MTVGKLKGQTVRKFKEIERKLISESKKRMIERFLIIFRTKSRVVFVQYYSIISSINLFCLNCSMNDSRDHEAYFT